jgi:hypothetical protein
MSMWTPIALAATSTIADSINVMAASPCASFHSRA